jgi:hypothetical protein
MIRLTGEWGLVVDVDGRQVKRGLVVPRIIDRNLLKKLFEFGLAPNRGSIFVVEVLSFAR